MTVGKIMFQYERDTMAKIVKMTFERKNTNSAGGNWSFLAEDDNGKQFIIMTPSMMSEAYYGNISAAQVLVVDLETEKQVAGEGDLTREINMHLAAYKTNPEIKSVFHAHAPHSMFWATSGLNMPNVTESTQKVGFIKVLDFEPNTTPELAALVKADLEEDTRLPRHILLDSHGVLILTPGEDGIEAINKAIQILDIVEWNADIAYKQTVFQKLGLLDGYYSKGQKIGTVDDLIAGNEIWNQDKPDEGYE